jgi:phosphoribosylamine--glycine ligase / phosphoribosylglycinamide formyltransferase / phosphoribosylformylglycinamidine cyclo-ligase
MPPAQDHKRLLNNDEGPNTGGMGAYCRCPLVSEADLDYIKDHILQKAINGMKSQVSPYVGVLYAGLMMTKDGQRSWSITVGLGTLKHRLGKVVFFLL